MVKEAVEDANQNAKLNKIDNIAFFNGLAEENLTKMIKKAKQIDSNCEIVTILDPARGGLSKLC